MCNLEFPFIFVNNYEYRKWWQTKNKKKLKTQAFEKILNTYEKDFSSVSDRDNVWARILDYTYNE